MRPIGSKFIQLEKLASEEFCFREDNTCIKTISGAHSVQKSKVLEKIATNNHVYQLDISTKKDETILKMKKKGIRKEASVFTGFCSKHDSDIFRPIDYFDYEPKSKEQEFLFAYRSIAKEYHANIVTRNIERITYDAVINGDFNFIKEYYGHFISDHDERSYSNFLNRTKSRLDDLNDKVEVYRGFRRLMNHYLLKKRYDRICTYSMVFDEEYHLAASSVFQIHYDLSGERLAERNAIIPFILNIFPQNGKTYVLLSSLSKYRNYFERLTKQLEKNSSSELRRIVSNILLINVENFYVSICLWDQIDPNLQKKFIGIFESTINQRPQILAPYDIDILGELKYS